MNAAVATSDSDLKTIAANSDGIVLMNYDEHQTTSDPGPIASQPWFVGNLARVLKVVPKEKLICAVGNYGYDWTLSIPDPKDRHHPKPKVVSTDDLSVSDAWERASDADADLDLDYDTLNPHFEYIDEDTNQRHVVWFLDAVSVLDEMRAARELGLQTFALWRLGEEDSSLWNIWDQPSDPDSLQALGTPSSRATTWTPRAKATFCASPACRNPASAPSKWIPTSPTRAKSSSSMSTWTSIRTPTPSSSTATTPTRSRSPSTTAPIPSGRRRFSTS